MLAAGPLGQCAMTAQALRRLDSASSVLLEVRGVALNFYLSLFFSVGYSSSSIAPLARFRPRAGGSRRRACLSSCTRRELVFLFGGWVPGSRTMVRYYVEYGASLPIMAPTRGGSLATFAQFDMVRIVILSTWFLCSV